MPQSFQVPKTHSVFSLPMRAIFSGSSQSGKSFSLGKIIQNAESLFGSCFSEILYYYPDRGR